MDAVPKGGAVRYIRQPDADPRALDALLGGVAHQARPEELEDAFMMMLRQHQDAGASAPRMAHGRADDMAQASASARNGGDGPVIVVRDLVRRFGDFTAVASTSFEVARGEIFGLLGPNGAGKTTTFRMLWAAARHQRPSGSGGPEPAHGPRPGARAHRLCVAEVRAVRQPDRAREPGILRRRLRPARPGPAPARGRDGGPVRPGPRAVSGLLPGGYKQRLAMAAGLLHEPEILFLDEPTSGIDPLARRAFWRAITALAQSGVTIVITTHFMEEAEYCDRIAIQDAGRMLALGTPRAVRAQAGAGAADMNSAFIAIVEQGRARRRRPGMSGSGFLRRFLALLRKEVRQMLRDKSNMAVGLLLPAALILLFGYGLSFDVKQRAAGRGHGRRLARRARGGPGAVGTAYLAPSWSANMPEAEARLRAARSTPSCACRRIFAPGGGAGARVQLVLNGSNSTTAQTLEGYVGGAIGLWSQRQAERAGGKPAGAGVEVVQRMWFNEAGISTWYLVPGLLVLVLTLIGAFLTSLLIAREWERGTLESLFVTPVRPGELVLAAGAVPGHRRH